MKRTMTNRMMLAAVLVLLAGSQAHAQTDPLPSWNDGAAKKAIVEFVKATTEKSNPKFVAPEARIAVFDQDGTTWVEQPMYTQVVLLPGASAGGGESKAGTWQTLNRSRQYCPATARRWRSSRRRSWK